MAPIVTIVSFMDAHEKPFYLRLSQQVYVSLMLLLLLGVIWLAVVLALVFADVIALAVA